MSLNHNNTVELVNNVNIYNIPYIEKTIEMYKIKNNLTNFDSSLSRNVFLKLLI